MLHTKLKNLRKNCALTQKQISDVIKVERSTYSCYETGKAIPPLETVIKLAKIFDVSLDYLLLDEQQQSSETKLNDVYGSYSASGENFYLKSEDEKNLFMIYRLLNGSSKEKLLKCAEDFLNDMD